MARLHESTLPSSQPCHIILYWGGKNEAFRNDCINHLGLVIWRPIVWLIRNLLHSVSTVKMEAAGFPPKLLYMCTKSHDITAQKTIIPLKFIAAVVTSNLISTLSLSCNSIPHAVSHRKHRQIIHKQHEYDKHHVASVVLTFSMETCRFIVLDTDRSSMLELTETSSFCRGSR
jgi:hypothetical protein